MTASEPVPPVDAALVRRLVDAQFPAWADLPVRAVEEQGHDNRTFRLGDELSVRLPSAAAYAEKVAKEQALLPRLGRGLPLPVPEPVVLGEPGEGYPLPWSVRRWLPGRSARGVEAPALAADLGRFLAALQRADATGGPPAGAHNFWRGGPLRVYDAETRAALDALGDEVDGARATALWEAALDTAWDRPPVWVHGDVHPSNLLVRDGRLSAVIDFGGCGVGDPACDLAIAWTHLDGASRAAFRAALPLDEATWLRGRAWALWKVAIVQAARCDASARQRAEAPRTLRALLEDGH